MTTKTSTFGVGKREGHDSTAFYERQLYLADTDGKVVVEGIPASDCPEDWLDKIICADARALPLPNESVHLAFTSPPYNAGKDYDDDLPLADYLDLIEAVSRQVYRVLVPGGRFVVNVANLGRKPYIPLTHYFYERLLRIGFLPRGEIIWQKAMGAGGSCAWGTWDSAKNPVIRDLHEYLLCFSKGSFGRPEEGKSTMLSTEFLRDTLSIWNVPPASARKVGHPAPFPVELAARVINLYSYEGDVVIDPMCGAGTTCVAAKGLKRRYVGVDIKQEYCELSERRLAEVEP